MDLEDIPLRLKKGEPIAFLDEYAVISDLHIGFEKELLNDGYVIWDKTQETLDKILHIEKRKLIILGDIRGSFTQILPLEGGMIFRVINSLSAKFEEVIITKGNHDGGLSKITSRLGNVQLVDEFIYKDIGFMHGHAMPSKKLVSESTTVCLGHMHPAVTLKDSNSVYYKQDCWLLMDVRMPKGLYPQGKLKYAVVFPKFNPYIGSSDDIKKKGIMKYSKTVKKITTDLLVV